MLYPTEEIQGVVAYSGENIENRISPIIAVTVSFVNGNDNKTTKYSRSVTFKRSIYSRNQLSKIEDSIESLSYSNNRIANYIEGRTLFRFDKLNERCF